MNIVHYIIYMLCCIVDIHIYMLKALDFERPKNTGEGRSACCSYPEAM